MIFFFFFYVVPFLLKVIIGSVVLLAVGLTVRSYPQGYGHDEDEHVDYYVGIRRRDRVQKF